MATIAKLDKLEGTLYRNNPLAKKKFGTSEAVRDSDGNYEWPVEVQVADEVGLDTIKVHVKNPVNPVQDMTPATPLRFENVRIQIGTFNSKQWSKVSAESVQLLSVGRQ